MSDHPTAITCAKRLCYLRDARKIQAYVRRDTGFNLPIATVERLLRDYTKRSQERRSFKPEPGRETCCDEGSGLAARKSAAMASMALGWAVQQYQERKA